MKLITWSSLPQVHPGLRKAIASPKPMLVVLHEWSNHRLAKKIRGSFEAITVTQENRDRLVEEIAKELRSKR